MVEEFKKVTYATPPMDERRKDQKNPREIRCIQSTTAFKTALAEDPSVPILLPLTNSVISPPFSSVNSFRRFSEVRMQRVCVCV